MHYKYKHIEAHSVSEYLKYLKKGYVRLSIDDRLLDSLICELNELKDKEKVFLFEYCFQLLTNDYETIFGVPSVYNYYKTTPSSSRFILWLKYRIYKLKSIFIKSSKRAN